MNAQVRTAGKNDVDHMIFLLEELFGIERDFCFNADKQRKGLELIVNSEKACVLIAEFNGKVAGMCSLQILISTAEGGHVGLVEDMVVAKGYEGKGIGKLLLQRMEVWAAEQGLSRLQLLADKNNRPALSFYEKMGWSRTQLVGLRKIQYRAAK